MKSTSLFLAGLLLGALAMSLISGREGQEVADSGRPAVDKKHQAEVATLKEKIAKLEGEKKAKKIVVAKNRDGEKPIRNKMGESPALKIAGGNKFQDAMKKQRENLKKNRIASELNRMRGSLSLTKEQEEAIGELIGKVRPETGFISFGGEEEGEEEELLSKQEADAEIRELLDEEQLLAFEELRARDRLNAIEAKANSELAGLQNTVNLTDEQKDAAFKVLTEFAAMEVDDPKGLMGKSGGWMERRTQKMKALSDVLTPEQVEIYSSTPQVITTSVIDGGWSSGTINLGSTATAIGGITLEVNEEVQIESE